MESQSRRFTAYGSSYLQDIADDFGGNKAARIGHNAAERYLAKTSTATTSAVSKERVLIGLVASTATILATNFGGCLEALESIYHQVF
mgnify:CR=1 FL=1